MIAELIYQGYGLCEKMKNKHDGENGFKGYSGFQHFLGHDEKQE